MRDRQLVELALSKMSSDGDKAPAAAKAGNSGKNSKQNKKGGKKGGQVKPEDFPLPEFVKVRVQHEEVFHLIF